VAKAEERNPRGDPPQRRAPVALAPRTPPAPSSPTWVVGVTDGYSKALEISGTGYRVVAKGTISRFALATATRSTSRLRRASPSRWRPPRSSRSPGSTSSRSARSPPSCASSASPTRTRARVCVTPARSSAARPERRAVSHVYRRQARLGHQRKSVARKRRHTRVRKKVTGTSSRPAGRLALESSPVRSGRRRHRRNDARVRVHHGGRPALVRR